MTPQHVIDRLAYLEREVRRLRCRVVRMRHSRDLWRTRALEKRRIGWHYPPMRADAQRVPKVVPPPSPPPPMPRVAVLPPNKGTGE